MPHDSSAARDPAPTPESNLVFVNQVDGALPGLWTVKCADRINLARRAEADDNPVSVTLRCKYHDVDQDAMRKTFLTHATTARWVMAAPKRPDDSFCKEYATRQPVSVPIVRLGQAQAMLVNASRFGNSPATNPTDPSLRPRDRRETPQPRDEAEESEADEETVELSQAEVNTIKEKLDNFLNNLRDEAEATYQDKFTKEEFPAASKRKLTRAIRTIQDDFCSGSCVGHASIMLIRQLAILQYDSLMVAYGFENNANTLGSRFSVAANEAIRLADSQVGEDGQYTLGDVLASYVKLAMPVKEQAEQRYEQLDRQKREEAHYAAMSSFHRHVTAPVATAANTHAPIAEFCGTM